MCQEVNIYAVLPFLIALAISAPLVVRTDIRIKAVVLCLVALLTTANRLERVLTAQLGRKRPGIRALAIWIRILYEPLLYACANGLQTLHLV